MNPLPLPTPKGHVPGAKLFAITERLDPKTHVLQSSSTFKAPLAQSGIDASQPVVTCCNSGHLSLGLWFVAHELLGNKQARVYNGSLHERTKDAKGPVTTARES